MLNWNVRYVSYCSCFLSQFLYPWLYQFAFPLANELYGFYTTLFCFIKLDCALTNIEAISIRDENQMAIKSCYHKTNTLRALFGWRDLEPEMEMPDFRSS